MKIGLIKNDYGWERVLEQEKTSWEIAKISDLSKYSMLILNSNDLNKDDLIRIKDYVLNGGSLLTDTLSFKKLDKTKKISKVYVKRIYGKNELFRNINSINIEKFCYKFKDFPLIYKSKFGKGFVIVLPFNLNSLMLDEISKKLYLPSIYSPLKENISLVSKGDLRRLIVNCFHYLHFVRNVPYIHVWYYPKNYKTVFSYRIDLDQFNKTEIDNITNIINKHKIKFTWFLSTINNKNYLEELKNLYKLGQDLQSHSHEHLVYDSYEDNYKNILESNEIISEISKRPSGFSAPFGHWNRNLGKALEKLNYLFSSEFSLSYDDMPFYPENSKLLQIPIYPACIGLMIMQLYSKDEMKSYLNYLIEMQYKKQMPLFLYDHPNNGIGKHSEVLDFTLNKIKSLDNVLITTMTEFAKWYKKREKVDFSITNNKVKTNNKNDEFYLRIILPGYKESRIPLKTQSLDIKNLDTKQISEFKGKRIRNVDILKSKLIFSLFYLKLLINSIKKKIL